MEGGVVDASGIVKTPEDCFNGIDQLLTVYDAVLGMRAHQTENGVCQRGGVGYGRFAVATAGVDANEQFISYKRLQ